MLGTNEFYNNTKRCRDFIYSPITVLTAEWQKNRCIANSGYKYARAPVLRPNGFYINTKRFRKVIHSPIMI